ncbi:hypothetical protein A2801_03760 [Candidatus Woesebacteria bacterium RIFCSPHIGHO2_01_FULL_41_10]|uniref:ComEC/Rec2-related protein domain-containing protein n=1 Tax=Candidatus Woesebacteria bacterium RIFCSPHIGHO2_01_FULL_41_10 TaxID=1802500 RepID=A0A1F7YMN6_9BACT|nr:MAG: hypothetical protein A2801_03760 [Candidatus Woesebacteria bacterium RIFCSPHIGHO2_01_FULL_41_10]
MRSFVFWFTLILFVIFRIISIWPHYTDGARVKIHAHVSSEPIRKGEYQYVKLTSLSARLPAYPIVSYGDKLVVEGIVKYPYLDEAKIIEHNKTIAFLFHFRDKIIKLFDHALPEPHSSLVSGIVIGARAGIPNDFTNALRSTGTAHVVVASGMNVTFVAGFLVSTFVLFMHRRKAIVFALSGIWLYVALSGFDAPLVRAGVMGTLAYSAQASGRVVSGIRALFISAACMLIIFPHWIVDLGFILSFLATYSLMVFEPSINRLIHFVPSIIREGLSTSLAAQIAVTPVLITAFGSVNPLSPIINALILWTIPPIMIIGSLGAIVGLFVPKAGEFVVILAYPFTLWFVSVVRAFV